MTSISYFTMTINGRLYPKAARTGAYAYAHEVFREGGKVRTKYLGVQRVPSRNGVVKKQGVVVQRNVRGTVPEEDNRHEHNGFVKIEGYQCVDCSTIISSQFREEHKKFCQAKEVITA